MNSKSPTTYALLRRIVAAACLALIAYPTFTARAGQDILFQHLTVKDGLSQASAMCMLQDSRGFMWIGTQDGLNRFDGYEFKIFKHDAADPRTIDDNFILFMAEDSSQTLWFGTNGNPDMLNKYDPATETFEHRRRDSVNLKGARAGETKASYTDPSGLRWKGSMGSGLTRTDTRSGKTATFRHNTADPKSIADDKVYSILGDHTGTIWVSTRGGLDRFDPKTETFIHYKHDEKNPNSISGNFVWPIFEDRTGTIWIGTFGAGLNRYDRATDSFTRYAHDEANPRSLSSDVIYSITQDASGMVWIGTGDYGADRFHPELANFAHQLRNPATPNSLADNNVASLYVERSGTVWIGTAGGLNSWDRKSGNYTLYKHDPSKPKSIADDNVQAILEDQGGELWFGTLNNGLDRYDRAKGTFTHYKNNPADPGSISDNRIYALCEDRKGNLWIGTYGGGLCRFDRKTQSFKRYRHDDANPASIGSESVWALLEDRDGMIWIGSFDNGVDRFDPEKEIFTHFTHSDSVATSLADNVVITLCQDRKGTIWVGTNNGLSGFQKESGTFQSYGVKDGLPNVVIVGIAEDDAGNLWISTNKGIAKFNPNEKTSHNYGYNDGLQGDEFNQSAIAKDQRTGELFFGGTNGFNVFQPEKLKGNPYVPPVVFSSFVRYNLDDEEGKPIEEVGIDTKPRISLTYKDNVVIFKFAALNYFNTYNNRYAYRLEGYNDNWIQLGTDRRATFTNLDAGKYVLQVKGSNNENVWNEAGAFLEMTITPPWWKTNWAYGTYGILFLGFLFTARRIEINRREQKARIRESQLQTKAVEAEKRALQAENERKTKELDDARVLQLSMLPKEIPKVPGYEIAVFMKTSTEVGGDYYDFTVTPDGTLDVAFGDATGHGMQAGTIVTLMKGLFISDASKTRIDHFFNHCSRAIKEIKLGRLYMALTLARFNGKNVSLSSAGMPPAYLYRGDGGSIEEILLKAVPLGSMKNFPYSIYETEMHKGDTLLFLTDGLPEQKNGVEEMFDYARVIDCFKNCATSKPDAIVSSLVKEAEAWLEGVAQDDDITLMVIKKVE